jgi:hypothetical protein
MTDAWEERRKALEDQYFEHQNKAAIDRLKKRGGGKGRPSPITGEPMEQLTILGIVADRCKTSGGIWLDAGELEHLVKAAEDIHKKPGGDAYLRTVFESLRK